LRPDGAFEVEASELVGSLDGLHVLDLFLKPLLAGRAMDPDTVRINLGIQ
jgi:hypothetical protein